MDDTADYPLAPFVNALRTITGRLVLSLLALLLGAYLGGLTATKHWVGGFVGIVEFHTIFAASIFFSVGIIALPATFFFILFFVRRELPLWSVLTVTLLIWWNTHKTVHWTLHDSPGAKMQKTLDETLRQAAEKLREERKKEALKPPL